MNPITFTFLALAMSTDAFAAAICKGVAIRKPQLLDALKMGLLFGFIEAIFPLIGWSIGQLATDFVEQWSQWIACALLTVLGLNMIKNAWYPDDGANENATCAVNPPLMTLIFTAIGTSIDSAAVGVSLAFAQVNIVIAALMIGIATTIMVTIGVMVGRVVGCFCGQRAELLGGMTLIGIGWWLLLL